MLEKTLHFRAPRAVQAFKQALRERGIPYVYWAQHGVFYVRLKVKS